MRAHLTSSLAIALLTVAPGLVLAGQESGSAAFMSSTQIEQAARAGSLETDLAASLGQAPSTEQIESLGALLDGLPASNPTLAAQVAQTLASITANLATDQPRSAVDLAALIDRVIGDPAVIAAAPETVGTALIALHETLTLAQRSAEAQDITLSGLDTITANLDALAGHPALLAAMPDLVGMIAEVIELANAQADLAGFLPAAGPRAARSVAAGVVATTAVTRASPPAGFRTLGGGGQGLPAEVWSGVSPVRL
jgi:hypothetical protein